MRHHRGLACRVGAAAARIAGTNPVLIAAIGQAGRCQDSSLNSPRPL
jgi:hypothetical protein